jgi:hypothetical protein
LALLQVGWGITPCRAASLRAAPSNAAPSA